MSYTITYKFGKALDVGETIRGNHLIRMSIEFTVEGTEYNEEHFAPDYGIKIAQWGILDWSRQLEENYMVPGNYDFTLFDDEETLKGLLFEGPLVPYVHKDGKVTLEIKYNGTANYVTEYVGYIDNTAIDYDVTTKMVSVSCYPKTDLLKNHYLYNDAQDGSGRKIGNNPLNVDYSVSGDVYSATATNVKTLIHNIFKKINPDCTLQWQHNWKFSSNQQGANDPPLEVKYLDELKFNSNYLSALFFSIDDQYRLETIYELLMEWAFTFGFICGMMTNEKAFVKDLFYVDENNLQTLGRVKKWIISNRAGDVEAVRITSRLLARAAQTGKNAYRTILSQYTVIPENSLLRGDNLIDKEIPVFAYTLSGVDYGDLSLEHNSNTYTVGSTRVPKITGSASLHNVLANFYYNIRNRNKLVMVDGINSTIGRVDTFTVEGINYDYMKDFIYAGNGYQILSLRKRLTENVSDIEALLVTDSINEYTPTTGTPPPKPFASVLPGGYLKEYSFNAKVIASDANASPVTLKNIEAGFRITIINMYFVTGFNNVTSFQLEDDDGVLEYSSMIIWDQSNNLITVPVYKDYPTQKTIKAVITTSGTVTTGEVDIEIKHQTRL